MAQHHPAQQVHEGGVGGEERSDHGAVQHLQRRDVQVVGQHGEQAEEDTAQQQTFYIGSTPCKIIPLIYPLTEVQLLVVDGVVEAAVLIAAQDTDDEVDGEEETGPAGAEPAAEEGGRKLFITAGGGSIGDGGVGSCCHMVVCSL